MIMKIQDKKREKKIDPDNLFSLRKIFRQREEKRQKSIQTLRYLDMELCVSVVKYNKRPMHMGHIVHLRKQFKSINTYDYIITLIKRRRKKKHY